MRRTLLLPAAAILLALTGCETQQRILADEQSVATQAALQRARFELNCPAAATVLSSQILQPIAWRGLERAEYVIGVTGCGRRETYIAVCQLGSTSCW